jgi:hypothetical protein
MRESAYDAELSWRDRTKCGCWSERLYDALMGKALKRGKLPSGEREIHHAIPSAFGGTRSSVVHLNFREHFIAHWLLPRFCKRGEPYKKMLFALVCMTKGRKRKTTPLQYATSKRAYVEVMRLQWQDPEYRAAMSAMASATQSAAMSDPRYRAGKSGPGSPLQTPEAHARQGIRMTGDRNPMRRSELSGENHANKRPENAAKISASHKARADEHWTKTEAGRASRARKQSELWNDPEYRAQQSAARKEGQRKRREREAAAGGVSRPDMVGDRNPMRRKARVATFV